MNALHPIFLTAFGKKAFAYFSISMTGFCAFVADISSETSYKPLFDLGLAGVVITGMATSIVFLAKSYKTLQTENRDQAARHADAVSQIHAAHAAEAARREDRLTKAIEDFSNALKK